MAGVAPLPEIYTVNAYRCSVNDSSVLYSLCLALSRRTQITLCVRACVRVCSPVNLNSLFSVWSAVATLNLLLGRQRMKKTARRLFFDHIAQLVFVLSYFLHKYV